VKTLTELQSENEELRDLLDFFIADVWIDPDRSCSCPNGNPPCGYCTDIRPVKERLEQAQQILGGIPEMEVWTTTPPTEAGVYRLTCEEFGDEIVHLHRYGSGKNTYLGLYVNGIYRRLSDWCERLTNLKWQRIYDPAIRIRELEKKLAMEVKENLRLKK
jgi:hypothetical protein